MGRRLTARTDLITAMADLGCRMTRPRRRLAAVLEGRRGSFGPEELLAEVPDVGRATVYRTIKLLLDAGIICRTSMPDGAPRYTVDDAEHHHHVICVDCGRVDEFRHAGIERILRALHSHGPGEVVGHKLELYRRCTECSPVTVTSRN